MKRLSATILMFFIIMISLNIRHTNFTGDAAPDKFIPFGGETARISLKACSGSQFVKPDMEEPAAPLNQAGNLLTPALRTFQ